MSTSKLGGLSLIGDQECWGPTGTTVLVYHSIFVRGLPNYLTPDGTSMKWINYTTVRRYSHVEKRKSCDIVELEQTVRKLGDQNVCEVDWNDASDAYKSFVNNDFELVTLRKWVNTRQTVTILVRTQKTREKFELKGSYVKTSRHAQNFPLKLTFEVSSELVHYSLVLSWNQSCILRHFKILVETFLKTFELLKPHRLSSISALNN